MTPQNRPRRGVGDVETARKAKTPAVRDEKAWPPELADNDTIALGPTAQSGPLGLDGAFPWNHRAPESLVVQNIATVPQRPSRRPTYRGTAQAKPPDHRFVTRLRSRIRGGAADNAAPSPAATPGAAPRHSVPEVVRDSLTPSGIGQIKALMFSPKLALTVAMRDSLERLARYGELGDKAGVGRSVLDLADKLDVSSSPDTTVLFEQESGGDPVSSSQEDLATQAPGTRSVSMTQAGRTLAALAPILAENGTFSWKDGMGRVWQRVQERFAHQAHGKVNVVLASGSGAPVGVGQWSGSAPAGTDAASPVGAWITDQPGAAAAGTSSEIGSWQRPKGDGEAGAQEAATGSWTSPKDKPVGAWTKPAERGPGAEEPSSVVGAWSRPVVPDGTAAGQGQWSAPGKSAAGGVTGQWTAPAANPAPGAGAGTSPTGSGAVGTWGVTGGNTAGAGPGPVGSWGPAQLPANDTPPAAREGSAGVRPVDQIQISDRFTLADILRANPNVTAVRLLERHAAPGRPPALRELMQASAATLLERVSP